VPFTHTHHSKGQNTGIPLLQTSTMVCVCVDGPAHTLQFFFFLSRCHTCGLFFPLQATLTKRVSLMAKGFSSIATSLSRG